jgi:cold shock CspA family protein
MVDDLLYGRVTSFRREQGFGVITLDDGRDVKFDASDCTMVPEEGEAVRLRVGPARWGGGFKALHVEPRGSSTLAVPAAPSALDQQLAALQREHLASALSEHVMAQLMAEAFGGRIGDASLIDVLGAYYAADPWRARTDGYVRFTRDHAPGDVLAKLAEIVPGGALPRAVPAGRAEAGERGGRSASAGGLVVRLPGGKTREVRDVEALVALINQALDVAGDRRRLWKLNTGRDWSAYYLLDAECAQRLETIVPLARR